MATSATFSKQELERHSTSDSCWVAIDGVVYDVTKFLKFHPGGANLLKQYGGKDATADFFALHRSEVLEKYKRLSIGKLENSLPGEDAVSWASPSPVPFAEVDALAPNPAPSPYYTESHRRFMLAVREFVDKEIRPLACEYDDAGKIPPKSLFEKMGAFGLLACRLGPGPHLKMLPMELPGGVTPDEFDYFHEKIVNEELARLGTPGFIDGIGTGLVIGLPPVAVFGNPELSMRVGMECLSGQKIICLAVSEPQAGSDVAALTTTARKSPCGKFYIVNGIKKWITNGAFADYFVVAVRTGPEGSGMKGVSFLFIERSEGVSTPKIETAYGSSAGTSYVIFEDVKVPVENLIGKENEGFKIIMLNFNHERWAICVGVVRAARTCIEECYKWTFQRRVFGKKLIEQPVIRLKLGQLTAKLESIHAWLEKITYQMNELPGLQQASLAPSISLLKYMTTRMSLAVSEQACQIFGGRAVTKRGMGQFIERFQRAIKFTAIYGGSEEIMADMAVRMATRQFPLNARL